MARRRLEQADEGYDHVVASISWTLGANLERLSLTGTADLNGTGNGLDNRLYGNAGANLLSGGAGNDVLNSSKGSDTLEGGEGRDTLNGGAGADFFLFSSALGPSNVDRITNFETDEDIILLAHEVFAALVPGPLAASAFVIGAAAADADHRIIYNDATGALLYDADGQGNAAAVRFATLNKGLALTGSDFLVV